jgi:hypothetical protein
LSLVVTGDPYFLSDIAEQIAWLAATLRLPSHNHVLTTSVPRLNQLPVRDNISTWQFFFDEEASSKLYLDTNGWCWTKLVANPILVGGFPIPCRRTTSHSGLETSLDIMTDVVRTDQVFWIGDRIIMKGFNALLIATAFDSSAIMWHALISSTAEERISYFDHRLTGRLWQNEGLSTLRQLEDTRHIIGWCSPATDFCGKY